ncbi:alpha-L-Rha alpha-1,3-L-rhamnosyltransferase [Vibrio breoganii]|nr:alpha-L-Rha alpha-1,3-L-rhamnosyltransferase [Vibrio breoganii]
MISVCMASFNGERYIEDQIRSVIKQLSSSDELIISDDGSTDNTKKIISELALCDARIKILDGPRLGLQKNFENALKHSIGDLIFLCDQDDVWKEDKVKLMVNELNDFDLVVSDCNIVDQNMNVLHNSFFKVNGSGHGLLRNIAKNSYLGCCMAFNRKILDRSLPFPDDIPMHDWWIGLVAQAIGKVKLYDIALINYRRHGSNASPTSERSTNSLWTKLVLRKNISIGLVLRISGVK